MNQYDSVVQCRLNRQTLATGLIGLRERGIEPKTLSQLLRTIFEAGVASMVEQGTPIPSVEEAIELLNQFKANLNPAGRKFKQLGLNVLIQREDEEKVEEFKLKEQARLAQEKKLMDSLKMDSLKGE